MAVIEIFLFLVLASVVSFVVHELGHVIAAHAAGGRFIRVQFVSWYGVGVRLEFPDEKLWVVALSGPVATGLLAIMALPFRSWHPVFQVLVTLNALLFITNLLPIRTFDGGFILSQLKRRSA